MQRRAKSQGQFSFFLFTVAALLVNGGCHRSTPPTANQRPFAEGSGQQTLTGRVVSVADGDTITLLDYENTQRRIRLSGIDAPELHQAFGAQSKKNLSDIVFDKDVTVVYEKTDQYGRLVGKILIDGRDINLEQVEAGMAWHYKEYQREQTAEDRALYAKAEDDARAAHRGLWIDPAPIQPSEFRREQSEER